jgi:hypothetical protein
MSDGYCYRTRALKQYIKLKLREYYFEDVNYFRLPSSNLIQPSDLVKLSIGEAERQIIIEDWHNSDEYKAIEAARLQRDADMAAEMEDESDYDESAQESYGDESDAESIAESIASTIEVVVQNPEINTVIRWGVQLSNREEAMIPLAIIHRIDRFLIPEGHVPSEELEEDENIRDARKRPLGSNEYDFLYQGVMPPAGTPLGIRTTDDIFDNLEAYVEYMNETGHEITVASVTGTPITGGRKKRKTKRSRKSRRTRRR